MVAPISRRRDRTRGDPHRIDAEQALRGTGDRVHDLVDVDGLERTTSLLDAHTPGRGRRSGRRRLGRVGQRRRRCGTSRRLRRCGVVIDHCHRGFSCSSLRRRAFGGLSGVGQESAVDHHMSWSLPAVGTTSRGNGSVITAVKLRVCQPSRRETVNLPAQRPDLPGGCQPVRPADAVSTTPRRRIQRSHG